MKLNFEEVADLLRKLYREEFGGKTNGRFKIARNDLAALSGRQYIKQAGIDEIAEALADKYGLMMVDLGDEFPILKISILRRYRGVPARLVNEHKPVLGDEEDDDA